jgi:peptidoglycan/LPS O-acetylase OafA/YrhL
VNHGRAEHHAGRLAAVGDLVLVAALLAGAALLVLARMRRSPVRAALGSAPLLLMAGLLPLIVTLTSRYPGNAWLSGLALGAIVVGVLVPAVGPAAHRLWRTRRSRR